MKKTIVLAEDNEMLSKLLSYRLEIDGYVVKAFTDGLGAVLYMRNNQFDLLITDLHMPVLDGCVIIQTVRETISKTVPIMVISGACDENYKLEILELGADVYVTKPVSAGELSIRVKHLVYNKKQREDGNV